MSQSLPSSTLDYSTMKMAALSKLGQHLVAHYANFDVISDSPEIYQIFDKLLGIYFSIRLSDVLAQRLVEVSSLKHTV